MGEENQMINRRTHRCTEVSIKDVGKKVTVAGWVDRRRDLGNLLFLDLRDRSGIIQLAIKSQSEEKLRVAAQSCRSEFVISATGIVKERESKNPELPTGDIEIEVEKLSILSKAKTPPFEICDDDKASDALRLKYRYLDLRRPKLQEALIMRHKIAQKARTFFDQNGFIEIETPMLIRSTPEGARDYLVPSRVHTGSFYALPQSPQLYKQLLMLAGMDRYFQVARCFRDEDLRADRQPEFTQIDLEMSFVDRDDVMAVNEQFISSLFSEILGEEVKTPLKRITYEQAMEMYGSDKPDTRFDLHLIDLTDCVKDTEFKIFSDAAKTGRVSGINVKGGAEKLSRKEIDKLVSFAKEHGGKGLSFTRLTPESESSSYEKFLTKEEVEAIRGKMEAKQGDLLLLAADSSKEVVWTVLGALRCHLAEKLCLIKKPFDLLWVVDFPLVEYQEEEDRYVAKHHPFTAVADSDRHLLREHPEKCHAKAYDMVINGCEVGGGSIRIHDAELQEEMFEALGFTKEQVQQQFGFLIDAFSYGVPPHGGMAYGLDRLVMLMLKKDSIRDVIAFPKAQNAGEPMTQSPSQVDGKQLEELGIQIKNNS